MWPARPATPSLPLPACRTQVRDTLGAIKERFERLRIEGGGVAIGRLAPRLLPAHPLAVKSVVMYRCAILAVAPTPLWHTPCQ